VNGIILTTTLSSNTPAIILKKATENFILKPVLVEYRLRNLNLKSE